MFRFTNRSLLKCLSHIKKRLASASCQSVVPGDPAVKVSILDNGVRVATEYQPTPLTCMSLLVEAGPRFETACLNGVTHFLEHMAYRGFRNMTKTELVQTLLLNGAKMTASTTREIQTFTGIYPSEFQHSKMVNYLASVVTDLELDSSEVEAEKYNICLEMVDEENDPRSVVFDYLHQSAFQGTPLSQRIIGSTDNVRGFDRNILQTFLSQHYQPYKLILCASGDVCHESMVRAAEARLGHMCGDPSFESDDGPARFTASQVLYRDDSMPFAHVALAFEAPGYAHPDYFKCLVAANMIGNWHKSRGGGYNNVPELAQAAAVEDICESYESFYIAYRDVGLWGLYYVSKKMSIEDMLENVQDAWKQLCITSQYSDLQRGINATRTQLAREMTGVVNSCHDMGTQLYYRCARMSFQDKLTALSNVKLEELKDCMSGLLYDKCPVVASVGPTETLPEYNRIRAGQYWLRL